MTTRQTTALLLLIVASATLLVACTPRDALPGQIVFTRRDGDVNVLYKANASGSGEELLYRNEDATNANILNPAWVPGGRAVTFTAMRDGTWRQMEIDLATHEVKVAEGVPDLVSRPSRADDLVVERGSVFVTEPDGKRKQLYYHKNYDAKFNVGRRRRVGGPIASTSSFRSARRCGGAG